MTHSETAKQLAAEFGGMVGKIGNDWFQVMVSDLPGAGYHIKVSDNKWTVIGVWSRLNGQQYAPQDHTTINVSRNRGVKALAEEIRCRFQPWYYRTFLELQGQMQRDDRNNQSRMAALKELAEAAGAKLRDNELLNDNFRHFSMDIQEVQLSENGATVALKTYSIPTDLAKQVIALIRGKSST